MCLLQNIRFVLLIILLFNATGAYSEDVNARSPRASSIILQLEINGVIGPATADYIERNVH